MESTADTDGPSSPVPTNSGPIQSILEDLESKFGKAKTKHDVIHALENCKYLHKIPLPPPNVALEQAEKDFCRERVLLNDVAFVPDRYDLDRAHAFALTLRSLLKRLMMHRAVFNDSLYRDHNTVCDLLMQRACRTSAGADSFFTVQKMLCIEGTFVTQKSLIDDPPIHIDAFLAPCADSDGESRHALCARVQVSNSFAIYDVSAMDLLGDLDDSSLSNLNEHGSYTTASSSSSSAIVRPWLDVESVVVDESNFLTGRHWRKLHLLITVPETGATYSSDEAHSPLKFREDSGLLHSQEHLHSAHNSQRLSGRKVLRDLSSWLSLSPTHTPHPQNQGTVSSVRQSTRSQQSHTSNTNTGAHSSMSLSQQMQSRPMPPLVLHNSSNNNSSSSSSIVNHSGSRGIALLSEDQDDEEISRRNRLLLLSPSSQDTPLSPLSNDVIFEGDEDDGDEDGTSSTVLGIKGVRKVSDHSRSKRSSTVSAEFEDNNASSPPSSARHYSLG